MLQRELTHLDAKLWQEWEKLLGSLGLKQSLISESYAQLKQAYQQRWRFYHGLENIHSNLETLKLLLPFSQQTRAVEFAIWFQDYVFQPYQFWNEEKSAFIARKNLRELGLPEPEVLHTGQLIMITKKLIPDSHVIDSNIICDVNLAVLGSKESVYESYRSKVRREYRHIPKFVYHPMRKANLKLILKRDKIYFTKLMQDKFEAQARKNLVNEVNSL